MSNGRPKPPEGPLERFNPDDLDRSGALDKPAGRTGSVVWDWYEWVRDWFNAGQQPEALKNAIEIRNAVSDAIVFERIPDPDPPARGSIGSRRQWVTTRGTERPPLTV